MSCPDMVGPGCSTSTQEAKLKEKIPFKFNFVARGVYWGYLYSKGDSKEVALPKCPLQRRWQLRKLLSEDLRERYSDSCKVPHLSDPRKHHICPESYVLFPSLEKGMFPLGSNYNTLPLLCPSLLPSPSLCDGL